MNALSLFSGIGGLDLAAEWAGFKTIAFCERDKYCQEVLRKHWPNVRIYDDIRTLPTEELPKIELLHGGYPCQPFSTAGARKGESDDRHLWPAMFKIVQETQPTWVVAENVKGHITLGLDSVLDDLEGAGYAAQTYCIPACSIGAVHRRERLFILAHSAGNGWNESSTTSGHVQADDSWRTEGQKKNCEHEGCCGVRPVLDWTGREIGTWGAEPRALRVDDGLPNRVDRNRVIGNAVSPQQAYPIFAAIAETYNAGIEAPLTSGRLE